MKPMNIPQHPFAPYHNAHLTTLNAYCTRLSNEAPEPMNALGLM